MENKWFVDEGYFAVFINRYVDMANFLADYVDWRFWHDWFHEKIIAAAYNWISNIGLSLRFDTQFIDGFIVNTVLAGGTKWLSTNIRKVQNGFVRSYALSVLLGVVLILGYLLLK